MVQDIDPAPGLLPHSKEIQVGEKIVLWGADYTIVSSKYTNKDKPRAVTLLIELERTNPTELDQFGVDKRSAVEA